MCIIFYLKNVRFFYDNALCACSLPFCCSFILFLFFRVNDCNQTKSYLALEIKLTVYPTTALIRKCIHTWMMVVICMNSRCLGDFVMVLCPRWLPISVKKRYLLRKKRFQFATKNHLIEFNASNELSEGNLNADRYFQLYYLIWI